MRIGMMVDTYKPYMSGVTMYIALNKQRLERLGHEVFVFTFGGEDYVDDESNIIRSPGLPLVDSGFYLSLRYTREAQDLLHTMDVIHVHHPFLSGTLAERYLKNWDIPVVFTIHSRYNYMTQTYLPMIPVKVGDLLIHAYLPRLWRTCDLVIAPSPGLRKEMEDFEIEAPIEVIPNGVDIKPFQEVTEAQDRARFGFSPDDLILVYVGRLGPEKNIPFLLRSFAGVAEAFDNVRLLLIGDGQERENVEDRVRYMNLSKKVHFTGEIPYDEMPSYLAMADAFVIASFMEVHPLTVIEAFAAGLPVLGIDSPGVGDTIQDGRNGFVTSNDLAAFTAKMVRLVTEHSLRQEMSENARKDAEMYSIERTCRIVLGHYQRLVDESSGRKIGFWSRVKRTFTRS